MRAQAFLVAQNVQEGGKAFGKSDPCRIPFGGPPSLKRAP